MELAAPVVRDFAGIISSTVLSARRMSPTRWSQTLAQGLGFSPRFAGLYRDASRFRDATHPRQMSRFILNAS